MLYGNIHAIPDDVEGVLSRMLHGGGAYSIGSIVADRQVADLFSDDVWLLDHCPACDKRISDVDPDGMEADSGQRWCIEHYIPERRHEKGYLLWL